MRLLTFDTETTGLPETKIINPDTLDLWPHIVQISFAVYDTLANNIVETGDYIIKVGENVSINEESIKFHKITKEISQTRGVPIEYALTEFSRQLQMADKLIGHNVSFDINVVKVELLRIIYSEKMVSKVALRETKKQLHYLTNYANVSCTLKDSIDLCDIKAVDKYGKTYKKWPKLLELHQKLFEKEPNNLHNSFNDILITLRCFIKMNYNIDLNLECDAFKKIATAINLL